LLPDRLKGTARFTYTLPLLLGAATGGVELALQTHDLGAQTLRLGLVLRNFGGEG
jgi:hypothetical protein